MRESVTICGKKYLKPIACDFGDYGGSGAVGLSNIREFLEAAGDNYEESSYNDFFRAADSESRAYDSDATAAIRALVASNQAPLAIHLVGDHSSESAFVLESWEEGIELAESLEGYPSLNDERVSEIEMEWTDAALDDYLLSDLERAAWPDEHEPINAEGYAAMSREAKFFALWEAMERENCYPVIEYSSAYIDVAPIAATWRTLVEERINPLT